MSGALDGIRVLDLSTLVQGPQAAAMLHGLGAEVLKIELPEVGDMGRHVGVIDELGVSVFFVACNRGKRSVALDLRTDGGKEAFLRLVETSDVVVSNFQPGTLEGWGLGYDDLAKVNPRIIWAAGSFLGPTGHGCGWSYSVRECGGRRLGPVQIKEVEPFPAFKRPVRLHAPFLCRHP